MTRKIWLHFKKSLTIYILIGIVVSFLGAINIYFFQEILDSIETNVQISTIVLYSVTLIIIPILSYIDNAPETRLNNDIYFYLKQLALEKISHISYLNYIQTGSGELLQKIESGSRAGRDIQLKFYCVLFRELLPETCFNLFFIVLIDYRLLPAIIIGYIIVIILTRLILSILQKMKEQTLISEERMNHILIRGINEMVTFRVNRRYKKEISDYKKMSSDVTSNTTQMTMTHEFFFGAFALLVAVIKVIIIILFLNSFISLSIGGLVALLLYVDKIYNPIAIFNVIFVQFNLDKISYKRLLDFFEEPNDPQLIMNHTPIAPIHSIDVNNLSVTIGENTILNDLSLSFQANQVYGLVGESGSGKSTFVKTILGLIKPTSGTITLNSEDLSKLNLNNVYQHVFYLSQDVAIFRGTLRENIVFDQDVDDEKIKEVIDLCMLSSFFKKLPDGLDTQISDRGSNISGGEKQRIAFSRLFFSHAEVVVIDEATSALDEETEEALLENIAPLFVNKIVMMITHRPNNLKYVNKIIEFKKV